LHHRSAVYHQRLPVLKIDYRIDDRRRIVDCGFFGRKTASTQQIISISFGCEILYRKGSKTGCSTVSPILFGKLYDGRKGKYELFGYKRT